MISLTLKPRMKKIFQNKVEKGEKVAKKLLIQKK
jgi:hypothetical protein